MTRRTNMSSVPAGTSFTLEIWERWADVRIRRLPDHLVIFDDELDWDDFDGDDATVTVFPAP